MKVSGNSPHVTFGVSGSKRNVRCVRNPWKTQSSCLVTISAASPVWRTLCTSKITSVPHAKPTFPKSSKLNAFQKWSKCFYFTLHANLLKLLSGQIITYYELIYNDGIGCCRTHCYFLKFQCILLMLLECFVSFISKLLVSGTPSQLTDSTSSGVTPSS